MEEIIEKMCSPFCSFPSCLSLLPFFPAISCRTVCSSSCIPLGRASPFCALRGLLSKPGDRHYTVFTLYFRVTYPSLTCVDITVCRVISHHASYFKDALFLRHQSCFNEIRNKTNVIHLKFYIKSNCIIKSLLN